MSVNETAERGPIRLRIGEFSRRVGVDPALLRAWESRYGLLSPERSPGGFRLYTERDEARVARMREHLDAGLPAAEAARLVLAPEAAPAPAEPPGPGDVADLALRLRAALDSFDAGGAHAVLDELLATAGLERALGEAVLPFLRDLGRRWADGEATVTQEHFASRLIEGRLLALASGWGAAGDRLALLACPPREEHTLGLVAFGLALRRRGWRIAYLGADTPTESIGEAIAELEPELVVMASVQPGTLEPIAPELEELARRARRLALGGAGASAELAERASAELLAADPVTAAAELDGA